MKSLPSSGLLAICLALSCSSGSGGTAEAPVTEETILARREAILAYITRLSEGPFTGTISGQSCYHGTEITDGSALKGYRTLVEDLHAQTGKWVGILELDYEFSKVFTAAELSQANQVLIGHARKGGLVTIHLTALNPWVQDESDLIANPGSWDGPGNAQDEQKVTSLDDLIDPTKPVHTAWMRKLDRIAAALLELKRAGVVVLWRPLQEMNGSWFWWGMSSHPSDPGPYVNLIRHMHDYFTNTKQLTNLLWVYSPNASLGQDNASSWNRTVDWAYPGDAYVDVIAGTAYNDTLSIEDYDVYAAMGKPLGMAEFGPATDGPLARDGSLDTRLYLTRIRTDYPRIAYWVSWHQYPGEFWSLIGNEHATELLNDPAVITRDDFPW